MRADGMILIVPSVPMPLGHGLPVSNELERPGTLLALMGSSGSVTQDVVPRARVTALAQDGKPRAARSAGEGRCEPDERRSR